MEEHFDTDTMSKGIYVNGYHTIKNTWHGTMIYNKHDMYIGRSLDVYGMWGYQEIEKTLDYATDVVLDVGANIGTHTLAYATKARTVLAFEPVPYLFQLLCTNVSLNCLENVIPINTAIGNTTGITSIVQPDRTRENNLGACKVGDGYDHVTIRKIDDLTIQNVTLIKIDVEGYECQVINGALDTIYRCSPVMLVENDRPEQHDRLIRLVESLDYSWQHAVFPLFMEDNYRGEKTNIFPDIHHANILCFPNRKGLPHA